ncbi:hypothetical protein ACK8GE_14285, partial [Micromonosporaceae bacterium DT194]|uniref:hypothetical protein n=1 Tax=Melissospora conviva TaxID=3388432 RepID=UPI003C1D49C4
APTTNGPGSLTNIDTSTLSVETGQAQDLARRLHVHGTHLATIDAHLLVVTTPDVWQIAGGGRPTTFIEVSPPATADVARQECADAGAKAAQVIEHTAIVQVLEKAAVADAARLARIVVTAVRRNPEAQLENLVQEVQGAYRNWDDELARWFNDEKNGLRARLFLVAAAMLEGEQAATILSTANALGKRLGDLPTAHPDGLAEAGLRTLTKVINAEIVDTRLRFRRAYYASAVLSFIHVDRSAAFRKGLWEWAIDLPLAERRGTAAERVVEMLVAMVLRHGDTRPLVRLVGWTGRSDLRPYVVQALTSTAVSDEVGVEVRALLYRWSRSSASDEHSLCTIAEVCSGELAELYPRVSLTRLGHLATRESVPVREAVVSATLRLWERPRLRRRVLDALIIWLGDDSDARTETAWQALTALASTDVHPVSYAAVEITTRRALTRAAARLFDRPGRVDLTSPFGASLLDAALRSADQENLVTDLLRDVVSCGDGGSKRLVRISRLAFEWQPVNADEMRPAHRDLRDRLCEALHQADPLSAEV